MIPTFTRQQETRYEELRRREEGLSAAEEAELGTLSVGYNRFIEEGLHIMRKMADQQSSAPLLRASIVVSLLGAFVHAHGFTTVLEIESYAAVSTLTCGWVAGVGTMRLRSLLSTETTVLCYGLLLVSCMLCGYGASAIPMATLLSPTVSLGLLMSAATTSCVVALLCTLR